MTTDQKFSSSFSKFIRESQIEKLTLDNATISQ